eukprot:comp21384_c0_seq2/m.46136 comp21384_c0_seq2/g.46136  ORF comp21384_c0_seq2/g.46136 comp21384_c0_seq2/m.46136 type:complete len:304 (-) comp21384_c0_seq2:437-1348(-)
MLGLAEIAAQDLLRGVVLCCICLQNANVLLEQKVLLAQTVDLEPQRLAALAQRPHLVAVDAFESGLHDLVLGLELGAVALEQHLLRHQLRLLRNQRLNRVRLCKNLGLERVVQLRELRHMLPQRVDVVGAHAELVGQLQNLGRNRAQQQQRRRKHRQRRCSMQHRHPQQAVVGRLVLAAVVIVVVADVVLAVLSCALAVLFALIAASALAFLALLLLRLLLLLLLVVLHHLHLHHLLLHHLLLLDLLHVGAMSGHRRSGLRVVLSCSSHALASAEPGHCRVACDCVQVGLLRLAQPDLLEGWI